MLEWTGERFLPWIEGAQIHYEHLHRYAFATHFVKGKRVLDLACGEGYGTYMLAREAEYVAGVEIDKATVRHAASRYMKDDLEFIEGSVLAVPIEGEKKFDVVVCFESIEHIAEHDKLLSEVKRLLKDNGLFIVSTPNKAAYTDAPDYHNPFHAKELYFDEFRTLLERYFAHMRVFGQRLYAGSNMWSIHEQKTRGYTEEVVKKGDREFYFAERVSKEPIYLIALASNASLKSVTPITDSWLTDVSNAYFCDYERRLAELNHGMETRDTRIAGLEANVQTKDAQIAGLETSIQEKVARIGNLLETNLQEKVSRIANLEISLQEKVSHVANLVETSIHAKDGQIAGLETSLQAKDAQIAELETSLQAKDTQIADLEKALDEMTAEADDFKKTRAERIAQIADLETGLDQKSSQMAELETRLREQGSRIQAFELEMANVQRGIVVRLMNRYQRIVERLLRPGTHRRYYYELALTGVRVILNEGWRSFFNAVRRRLWVTRAMPKAAPLQLPEVDPSMLKKEARKLEFPRPSENPEVSIVVPAYNKLGYTLNCLKSIAENTDGDYEVLVIDDGSTDETTKVLSRINNLRLVRNEQNVGFIESCNRGAGASKGEGVLFLNNDTMVTKCWLPPLLEIIRKEDVGAVGSKLVYPDGRLQEAGGIIWTSGYGWNYGRGDKADKPEYNYVREVDYCSGCCLLVRKELFERIGGFDERFGLGYYEDTDLCFTVRDMGYKVMYQPMSVVVHFEGVTCGTDVTSGIKKYQEINRPKFLEKWNTVLQKSHYDYNLGSLFLARDRRLGQRILVIDQWVPRFDRDSGSLRMANILRILSDLGHRVTFIGTDLLRMEPYTEEFQRRGIEVLYAPYILSIEQYMMEFGKYFDLFFLSRPGIAIKYIDMLRKSYPGAKIIFDTVDLAFLRLGRMAKIENDERIGKQAEESKTIELYSARNSDLTLVVSAVERELLLKEMPSLHVEVVSNIHHVTEPKKTFAARRDVLFIGGFDHTPNIDAVKYFVNEIFPVVKKKIPDLHLYVVGNIPSHHPAEEVLTQRSDDVTVTGYVKDITPYFESSRIFVAPLRYGAGVKGKINQSMSYGLPVITTTIGAEGAYLKDGENALIADDPADFAEKVVLLYTDEGLWNKLSCNSITNIEEHFSYSLAKRQLKDIVDSLLPTDAG